MNIHEYILLSNFIFMYVCMHIYIYMYMNFVFLFIATLSQLIRTIVTLVSHSYDLFLLVLLVDTAYTILKKIQVINKVAKAT